MDPIARILSLAAAAALSLLTAPPRDDLDTFIQAQMSQRQINGLSLAIIQDGKIEARAYGVTSRGGAPVTTATLFQAGSISKPVAAMGALRLVEQGALSLDEDVNAKLKSWKVPENEFTRKREGHTAPAAQSHRGAHRARLSGLRRHRADAVHGAGARWRRQHSAGARERGAGQPRALLGRRLHGDAAAGHRCDRQAVSSVHERGRARAPRA